MYLSYRVRRAGVSSLLLGLSVVCAGLMLSLSATPAWAQSAATGTVSGQVTDPSNAVIVGADVTLVDTGTNISKMTTTNDAGRYVFVNVAPGVYDITVSKTGFSLAKFPGQKVTIGLVLTVNVRLEVGAATQTIVVEATPGAELQTTNATVGTTLSGQSLMLLPNLGRDVTTLAVLQPGTTPSGFTAGAYADQNTFTIDGGNNSDDMAGNYTSYTTNFTGTGGTQNNGNPSGVLPTPVESIEEFKVGTFNQTADFNNSIGGQVQMVTKRGTNLWHGSAYEYYFGSNVGAANTWDNNHTRSRNLPYTPLPSNHRNRFGGAVGGPITPKILGGKTFFFFNYEGSRFPNVATFRRPVPSAAMRAGVIQVPDGKGIWRPYNLNPTPVTVNGVNYDPAACPASANGLCDPRGLGLNTVVKEIWKQMPLPTDPNCSGLASSTCDQFNTQAFVSTLRAPLTSDSYVGRIDHDFSQKWRFMSSYRFLRLENLTNNQVDIGGGLPGDTLGQPVAKAPRNQVPSFFVAGLTTNITPTTTNNFVYNYTRNFWQWGSANAPPQQLGAGFGAIGGAVEIANPGSSNAESINALIPYNVNTQNIRQRFWDGKDNLFRDDLTMIKGNHLFQLGGLYQRNFDFHTRTDNGQGINNQIVYQIASSGINFTNSPYIPTCVAPQVDNCVPATQQSKYRNAYSEVLGLVSQSQVAYTRSGPNLALGPVGGFAFDQSIIPTYNVYFSDTWHLRPAFTLTYGLGYTLEMPPFELTGKQVALVDAAGNLVNTEDYLAQRKQAALAGQVYNPILGFATVNNVRGGLKYPYNPFYGGFSPRVAAAWTPNFSSGLLGKVFGSGKTVLRGGYGRIYGRLNGVNLVLVPLLGPGLLQAVSCTPNKTQSPNMPVQCGNVDPTNVFRIGADGLTAPLPQASQILPQPFLPGVGGNISAGDVTVLDPHYRPERTDNFTLTIQRELSSKMSLEVGYIGRIIRNEFREINLDAVPYMTTLTFNGQTQTFANAYANVYIALCGLGPTCQNTPGAVATQPWFEKALGGAGSAYCRNAANNPITCTAAVLSRNRSLIASTAVSDLWRALYSAPSWTLPRSMISAPLGPGLDKQGTAFNTTTSLGFGNYNALFVTFRARDWHGVTAVSNFTWGRALGTGTLGQANSSNTALDVWNMQANYGPNLFDIRFLYNLAMYYQPPYFRSRKGILGHLLGGWTFAPLFTAQSGGGTAASYSEGSCTRCQAFGEVTPTAQSTASTENAVFAAPYTGGNSLHYNVSGSNGIGTSNPTGLNMFADPAAVYKQFRPCILGFDTSCGGYYNLRGLPLWNLDMTVAKDIGLFKEGRVGASFFFQFTNLLNHFQPGNPNPPSSSPSQPSLSLTDPQFFGRFTTQTNTPRNMEFGLRFRF